MTSDLRRLAVVPRWGIVPTLRRQSVAEHSYFVAMYVDLICSFRGDPPEIRLGALRYALEHDVAEAFTGDLPSPVKGHIPDLSELEGCIRGKMLHAPAEPGATERAIVRAADRIEAYVFLAEERAMGNTRVGTLLDRMKLSAAYFARLVGVQDLFDRIADASGRPVEWYVEGLGDEGA